MPAWSEGHPLSEAANHLIASMVRKVGGFTFQELNLTIDDIRATGEAGADLSYDFITRPAYQHALATGDTEFLRLTPADLPRARRRPRLARARPAEPRRADLRAAALVHRATATTSSPTTAARSPARSSANPCASDMCRDAHRRRAPYNLVFTTNGIACTTRHGHRRVAGHHRPRARSTSRHRPASARAHLLLAMYNALQPGVFALSGWDLCGMLTLPPSEVAELLRERRHPLDQPRPRTTSWASTRARRSRRPGCRAARSLYGSLPEQLDDETSFPASSRRSSRCGSTTGSRPAARSTSRTCRTGACS